MYPNTKVFVVANLYGTSAKFDEICAIVEKHGAIMIEDAAEPLGSAYNDRQAGNIWHIHCYFISRSDEYYR